MWSGVMCVCMGVRSCVCECVEWGHVCVCGSGLVCVGMRSGVMCLCVSAWSGVMCVWEVMCVYV